MQDIKLENLELFYDCVDESNNLLYEVYKRPYFELIEMTVNNILAGEILNDLDDENHDKLQKIYDKYSPYTTISFLFDKENNQLGYKDSPLDCGKDKFLYLFRNRVIL